jgi:DNA replication and repair protein RecF
MRLIDLAVRDFRNIAEHEFDFAAATNVILGANGAGKTSLLEAVVVLGNLRSFRAAGLRRAVRHGERSFRLAGSVSTAGRRRRLEVLVEAGPPIARTLRVDGLTAPVDQFLQLFPVFAITAQDHELVTGGPEGRRAFLDRFVFLLQPSHIERLRSYRRLIRQRNAALVGGAGDAEIKAWEEPLAAAAAAVVEAREMGGAALAESFSEVWQRMSQERSPRVAVEYRSENWKSSPKSLQKLEDLYRQRYNETRTRDRQMGFTVDGPHRHDVSIKTEGRSVRYVLSSGQTKGVAAALRIAALRQVERERKERFPIIVDDVDAELDDAALTLLVRSLGGERQIFLSSTSEEVAEFAGRNGCCIRLENGKPVAQEKMVDD